MRLVEAGALLMLVGGALALALCRYPRVADAMFRLLVVAGCALTAIAAVGVLAGHPAGTHTLQPALPGGPWRLELDALSAWFLLLLSVTGGITTLFGVAYTQWERAHRSVAALDAGWVVLLVSMIGVLLARSALLFLITWEVMAVSAYFLMMFEHDRAEVRRAGLVYLIATHLGTLALIVMFLSWGRAAADLSFASLVAARGNLPFHGAIVLLLALVGFGIKAGMIPLHFWLPGAHAAAPSHVSALLSGVMLKIGVYGLFRVVSLLGPPPAWWGWGVFVLGLASAVLGVLYALSQHDIKRALAYSSVENVGIILLGLGLGVLGTAYHQPAVALLGYAGALLHALNHSLFKSLLFLGAGVVVHATGTREIDRLGGLARVLPTTTLAFLIGSVAIVGLPPLNGFVSEWILIQGCLSAGGAVGSLRLIVLGAAGLGLVGAVALACFVRLAGIMFLGTARDCAPHEGVERLGVMLPMSLLVGLCVFIGFAPLVAIRPAMRMAAEIVGTQGAALPAAWEAGPTMVSHVFGPAILLLVLAVWVLRQWSPARAAVRWGGTWACGFAATSARVQYTAASFSLPIIRAFPMPARAEVARRAGSFLSAPGEAAPRRPVFLWRNLQALADRVRLLQHGRVTSYLQYMIWTVLLLLVFLLVSAPARTR